MKKKILFVTEAHFHSTGYSVYTKEILSRLSKNPNFEVAELACFTSNEAEELKNVSWKVYPNVPPPSNHEANQAYNASMQNKFGEFTYNHVLIDFKPDFVMDIRDWWMLEFEERSPFRDFYNWAIMPTVDAKPQNWQWINTYSNADAVFTYSEFGRDVLLEQSNNIKFAGIASPCANENFCKIEDKAALKEELGLSKDSIIIGTVMRNQRRKLYPDLFHAFRKFLDENPSLGNVYLYCHTSYPDVGWDFPELIYNLGLANRVLFTYKCKHCGHVYASFFNDAINFCPKCKTLASTLVGIGNKIDDTVLNKVYNLFDIYVQWANSEGWGMPQLEAAYAGLPVVSVNYSAMESLVKNIGGIGIDPKAYYKELETGCLRAVPDNDALVHVLTSLVNNKEMRENLANQCYSKAREIYNWDYAAKVWEDYFLKTPTKPFEITWGLPARIFNPPNSYPDELNNIAPTDQANWLFANVLNMPNLIGGSLWRRVVKDLTYRLSVASSIPGYYYNEYSHPDMEKRHEEFNFNIAFKNFVNLRNNMNAWEGMRTQR